MSPTDLRQDGAPQPQGMFQNAVNTLARTAVKLAEPRWKSLAVEVQTGFDLTLPKVVGDSNQLHQVCLQLVGNCLDRLGESGGRVLTVSTEQHEANCQLKIRTPADRPTAIEAEGVRSHLDREDALGLTACQGILLEHQGRVFGERGEDGSLLLCMELPAALLGPGKTQEARLAARWQSQPSV